MLHDKVWQQTWELPQQSVGLDGPAWNSFVRTTLVHCQPHLEMLFLICHCCLSRCLSKYIHQGRVQTRRGRNLLEGTHLSFGSLPRFGPFVFTLWSERDRERQLKPSSGGSTQGCVCVCVEEESNWYQDSLSSGGRRCLGPGA